MTYVPSVVSSPVYIYILMVTDDILCNEEQ